MGTNSSPAAVWVIRVLDPSGIVCAEAKGELDLVLVIEKAAQTLAAGASRDVRGYLIDDRQVRLELTTLELYELPDILSRLGLSRRAKVAVVHAEAGASSHDFAFFETVAANFGFQIRLFTGTEEALDWLMR